MRKHIQRRFLTILIIFIVYGIVNLVSFPGNLDTEANNCYTAILCFYLFFGVIVLYVVSRKDFDIFEPIIILLVMYFGIFIFRPLQDIINNDYYSFGVNVLPGGVRATGICAISLLSFCFGYYGRFRIKVRRNNTSVVSEVDKSSRKKQFDIVFFSLVIWSISFVLLLLYLLTSGKSLQYIFSIGRNGLVSEESTSGAAALTFFAYSMIAPWMYICVYSKKRWLKILLTILMVIVYVVRGTRIVLIIMISAPVLYYYIVRCKRPKFRIILAGLIGVLLLMSLIQASRGGIRTGSGVDLTDFSTIAGINVFDADLTTYKQFYAITDAYPSKYSYTYGRAMIIQTLTTIIPRAIWHGKPDPVIQEVIENAVNGRAAISGMASPGIGEYYFEFGVLGCLVCMFLLGYICSKWKNILTREVSVDNAITYGVLYGLIFQIVIRTSTASCVYQFFFSILPIYIINYFRITDK